MDLQNKRLHFL